MKGNSHYILTDEVGRITDGWSDGPNPEREIAGAVLLREDGGYQFRLWPDGEENPSLEDEMGAHLYRHENGNLRYATEEEIAVELAEIESNKPEIIPTTEERVKTLEDENRVLKGELAAQQESSIILEECLVEMAGVIYA